MATSGAPISWCAAAAAGCVPDPHGAGDSSSTLQPGVHPWRTRPLYDAAEDAWLWLRVGWNVAFTCSLYVGAAAEVAAKTMADAAAAAAAEEFEQLQLLCPCRSQESGEGEGCWTATSGGVSG